MTAAHATARPPARPTVGSARCHRLRASRRLHHELRVSRRRLIATGTRPNHIVLPLPLAARLVGWPVDVARRRCRRFCRSVAMRRPSRRYEFRAARCRVKSSDHCMFANDVIIIDHVVVVVTTCTLHTAHYTNKKVTQSSSLADTIRGCSQPLVLTNSYTKALAIDVDSNRLIECTSLYQGRCRTRNLSNIRRESEVHVSRPGAVANDQHSSAIVFVGSGPATSTTSGSDESIGSPIMLSSASIGEPATVSLGEPARVLYVGST